jgi:lipid-binding SYLF domain-containing protein
VRERIVSFWQAAPALKGPEGYTVDKSVKKFKNVKVGEELVPRMTKAIAVTILVFPAITKAGFIVGGQFGEGVLIKDGRAVTYYNTVSASYGLQAGIQKYGYAMFLMTDSAAGYLDKSDGWELGAGPSIVIVDVGAAKSLSTTTARSDVYAFFFDQKGLMAGLGLQGTKVTKISK